MEQKYRYIYKITCLCGDWKGKYYIGQHTTKNLNDGYAGSGVRINEYYSKYRKSINTYRKEILAYADTQQELDKLEAKYVNNKLGKKKCLNIDFGGLHYKTQGQKLLFHLAQTTDEGELISCEILSDKEETNNYNITDIPLYETHNGKLYSKSEDLRKHGITFYDTKLNIDSIKLETVEIKYLHKQAQFEQIEEPQPEHIEEPQTIIKQIKHKKVKQTKPKKVKQIKSKKVKPFSEIYVYKDNERKKIQGYMLQDYLDKGWKQFLELKDFRFIVYVYKDNKRKRINRYTLQKYLDNGWSLTNTFV